MPSSSRPVMPRTRPLWPAPLAGLAALILYARTLAPGLTWAHHAADGGDLLAAALTGGVPHPSGYPTYQLLLRAAIALFPGEPARAGNWLSALCAAAAVSLIADLAGRMLVRIAPGAAFGAAGGTAAVDNSSSDDFSRSARPAATEVATTDGANEDAPQPPPSWGQIGPPKSWGAGGAVGRTASPWSGLVALAAALAWAVSPGFWGQAVVTEVYALNALAVVALLWLLWRWREAVDAGQLGRLWLVLAGLVFGLGLGNHLTLLLMAPAVGFWLWAGRGPAKGSLRPGLWLALAALLGGLAVYAYLPLAAAATPPVNWEDPGTPQALWALVSGRIYRGLVFGLPPAHLPDRLLAWMSEVVRQFGGLWAALLVLAGLWRIDHRQHAWWQTTGLIGLAYSVYAVAYNTPDSFVYLIPVWCVMALWLAVGMDWLLEAITQGLARGLGAAKESGRAAGVGAAILAVLILAVPVVSAARFWRENDLSHDREASDFVTRTLADAAPAAIILTSGDGATFALWYAIYGLGQRPDVAPVNVNLISFDWYRRALAKRHPEFAAALSAFDPAQPEAALAAMAAQRPFYRAETLSVPLPGFDERMEGSLVRLTPPADGRASGQADK